MGQVREPPISHGFYPKLVTHPALHFSSLICLYRVLPQTWLLGRVGESDQGRVSYRKGEREILAPVGSGTFRYPKRSLRLLQLCLPQIWGAG